MDAQDGQDVFSRIILSSLSIHAKREVSIGFGAHKCNTWGRRSYLSDFMLRFSSKIAAWCLIDIGRVGARVGKGFGVRRVAAARLESQRRAGCAASYFSSLVRYSCQPASNSSALTP